MTNPDTNAARAAGEGLGAEFRDGYIDGRDMDAPEPSGNRSDAYRHSFAVGRAEMAGQPIPAAVSRARASAIASAAHHTKEEEE